MAKDAWKCPECGTHLQAWTADETKYLRAVSFVLRFAVLVALCAIVAHVAHTGRELAERARAADGDRRPHGPGGGRTRALLPPGQFLANHDRCGAVRRAGWLLLRAARGGPVARESGRADLRRPASGGGHPPCLHWCLMANCVGKRDGQDDGCFAAAMASARSHGGVVEHPAHSLAWRWFGLCLPPTGAGGSTRTGSAGGRVTSTRATTGIPTTSPPCCTRSASTCRRWCGEAAPNRGLLQTCRGRAATTRRAVPLRSRSATCS